MISTQYSPHLSCSIQLIFLFTDSTATDLYPLSLHDALPIYFYPRILEILRGNFRIDSRRALCALTCLLDRKSTRLNSSHLVISYAGFCLKKKTAYRLPPNNLNMAPPARRETIPPAITPQIST